MYPNFNPPNPQSAAGKIESLIQGVSQQPYNIRFVTQADECVNHTPSLQEQLDRRNPLEVLHKLDGLGADILAGQPMGLLLALTSTSYPYTHFYRRDANEAYVVVFTGKGIRVFSVVDGTEKTVHDGTAPSNTYLTNTQSPSKDFFCYTYKDTTFVVNRNVITRMLGEAEGTPIGMLLALTGTRGLSAVRGKFEGKVKIKDAVSGNLNKVTVTIGGDSDTEQFTSSTATTTKTAADYFKTNFNTFVTNLGGEVNSYGNVFYVSHPTKEIQISVEDSRAGTTIESFTDEVSKVADLTNYGVDGYIVKVTGSTDANNSQDSNTSDDVYYKFETSDGTEMSSGKWVETVAPGIPQYIDPETMPHQLVRNADGTFTFGPIQWGSREVGDEFTNPTPAFIGSNIHSVYLASNRFGINGGGFSVLSKAEEQNYFDFFKTTILTSLDTDPITMPIPSSEVNETYWSIQWNGELIHFGNKVDGAVSWNNTLAPNRITINTPTKVGLSEFVPPFLSGSSLFFVKNKGEYSSLNEYSLDPVSTLKSSDRLSNYVSRYIPKNVISLAGTESGSLFMLTELERNTIYPFHYSKIESRYVQQAFHKWVFDSEVIIYGMWVEDDIMNILYHYRGEVFIGTIDLYDGAVDTGLPSKVYMDHRIDESDCTVTYDASTNRTTIGLPHDYANDKVILELREGLPNPEVSGDTWPVGYQPTTVENTNANEITLAGDWRNSRFYVGLGFTSYYDPSRFIQHTQKAQGQQGTSAVEWRKINCKRVLVSFYRTSTFSIQLIDKTTGEIYGEKSLDPQLDNVATIYDTIPLYDGTKLFSEEFHTETHKLRLINSTTKPSQLSTISWKGEYYDASF